MHEPAEKSGLRNAWGRVAEAYDGMWAARTAHITAHGLDMLAPAAGASGVDVACGPGHTTAALADRLGGGRALGVDFAPEMVSAATRRFGGRAGVAFAVDDAEHLSLPPASADVITCTFGLMYCYDSPAALRSAAQVLRPGGRMLQVVWGRAAGVWWVPVIEAIETRAAYFSAVCPMMFFYGLPGVLPRMAADAGLTVTESVTLDSVMTFDDVPQAVDTAVHGCPLAGIFAGRLDPDAQAEVRELLAAHIEAVSSPAAGGGIEVPAEAALVVAERPG